MKVSHMALVFVLLFVSFLLPRLHEADNIQAVTNRQIVYNQALDNAVADAVSSLTERDSRKEIVLNKELAKERFFKSLYSTLGIVGEEKKKELEGYIPVILVTVQDGFYLSYHRELPNGEIHSNWSEKLPYEAEREGKIFNFTLEEYLKIYDRSANQFVEGDYRDLAAVYPDVEFLQSEAAFDRMRRDCIISHITEEMRRVINTHNRIAGHFGIAYNFVLPNISKEDWYRTIDDSSFLAIFQGYPYGQGLGYYNRYAVGGARIRKSDYFYLSRDESGKLWYHRADCEEDMDQAKPFYSKEDCAKEGAFACPVCNP